VKILVIEDEIKTSRFLRKGFSEACYVVDVAGDGLEGLALGMNFDLIILDVMLPAPDGWQVLARLREEGRKRWSSCSRRATLSTNACADSSWERTTTW